MSFDRIIVITRQTRLEKAVQRFNTKSQARFYVKSRGQSFDDYELEDSNYKESLDLIMKHIPRDMKVNVIDRTFLPNYVFGPNDLVVTLGQDGLVVNTAKYLTGQPIFAINPDPQRFDGILLPFLADHAGSYLMHVLNGNFQTHSITMAEASLADGQKLYSFNDFFIGPKSHTSALYQISYREKMERHSSSGIIVSTPAGLTGWMSSLFNMANGMMNFASANLTIQLTPKKWEDRQLIFCVREPFRSKWSNAEIVAGEIRENESLHLESQMAEGGVIFSDGMEQDFLEFNSGAVLNIGVAKKTTSLIYIS